MRTIEPMELVDTHCHLCFSPLLERVPQVLERARAVGVHQVIVPAYDVASWPVVTEVLEQPGVYGAFGLHPWVAGEGLQVDELARRLELDRAVAVGEIGLDHGDGMPSRQRQEEVLRLQLQLARDLDLPVILHCRRAFDELVAVLKCFCPGLRGVVHAYSRGPILASVFIALGLQISFGGAITRPRAKRARQSASVVPLERILLETDAPSIGLQGVEPPEVEPAHVAVIARQLAELRGEPLERVARVTTNNARALFRLG